MSTNALNYHVEYFIPSSKITLSYFLFLLSWWIDLISTFDQQIYELNLRVKIKGDNYDDESQCFNYMVILCVHQSVYNGVHPLHMKADPFQIKYNLLKVDPLPCKGKTSL